MVWAYAPDDPYAYVVWAEKHKNMSLEWMAKKGLELEAQFKPMKAKVIDTGGLGGTISNHMKQRFDFSCIPAEKKHKMAFIETMNDDLQAGLVKVLGKTTEKLVREWETLETDDDGEELKRHQDNHCADAALYAWRRCRHFLKVPKGPPQQGEEGYEEWFDEQLWKDIGKPRGDSVWGRARTLDELERSSRFSEALSEDWGDLG